MWAGDRGRKHWRMLNPPFEVGPAGWIYLRGKCRNFYFL